MKTMLVNKFLVSECCGISVVISLLLKLSTVPALTFSGGPVFFEEEYAEQFKEDTCQTPSGHIGKCVNINDCSSRLAIIKDSRLICGWETVNVPKICCIDHNETGMGNCTTTDSIPGYCLRFTQCQHILSKLLEIPFDPETITYVLDNRCGTKKFDVCCPSEHKAKPNDQVSTENSRCNLSFTPPDVSSGCCGQGGMIYRNIPGEIAEIAQYPWTAILEYEHNNSSELKCGGVLISGQYVLTTAHCVSGAAGEPINVHLGDYNIEESGPHCVEIEGGGVDCSPEAVSMAIEKVIPHPDFDALSSTKANDIALVRMAKIAPYTDFIRPICLPTADIMNTGTEGIQDISLDVAGWGLINDAPPHSSVKSFAKLSFVRKEDCLPHYSSNSLGDEYICACGEEESKQGDAGGALMLNLGQEVLHTEVVGLASFGSHPCGQKARPAVYTNVYHYLAWIRKTIFWDSVFDLPGTPRPGAGPSK